jgi:hypothetical protein
MSPIPEFDKLQNPRPLPFPRSPSGASNCREAYIRRDAFAGSIGLPPITQTKLPASDFVAFRVPANPVDPAPCRL